MPLHHINLEVMDHLLHRRSGLLSRGTRSHNQEDCHGSDEDAPEGDNAFISGQARIERGTVDLL
jgi:hypothetical protein